MTITLLDRETTSLDVAESQILGCKEFINLDIYNPKKEKLGSVKELIIDYPTGSIMYLILSFGGFLGMGERLTAIPWREVRLGHLHKTLVLDITTDKLKAAPNFEHDKWPDMSDSEWAKTITTYYSHAPSK